MIKVRYNLICDFSFNVRLIFGSKFKCFIPAQQVTAWGKNINLMSEGGWVVENSSHENPNFKKLLINETSKR